jgi:ribose transport system permease protein
MSSSERTIAETAALSRTTETGVELAEEVDTDSLRPGSSRALYFTARFGLLGGLLLIMIVFGIIKPGSFLSVANLKSTAEIAAPLLVLSVGLTVPLSIGEFDLSIANASQLAAAVVIWLICIAQVEWGLAIVITAIAAVAGGALIGYIVVRSGVNAFIVTLGAGTAMAGLEFGIAHGSTIFSNIPSAYVSIGVGNVAGIPISVIIAVVFALLVWLLMEQTVAGRRMRAIGGNSEAARLAGVRVDQLRMFGFIMSALSAAIAAVLITAAAASYYPNAVTAQLLPAYAACFLGTTVFRSNVFEVTGTVVGVAFLAVIQDGLIISGVPSWSAQVVEGLLLIIAVVASKAASRSSV